MTLITDIIIVWAVLILVATITMIVVRAIERLISNRRRRRRGMATYNQRQQYRGVLK